MHILCLIYGVFLRVVHKLISEMSAFVGNHIAWLCLVLASTLCLDSYPCLLHA